MSKAKAKKVEWEPGVEHEAVENVSHVVSATRAGQCAHVRTALGVVPCWPGDFIVPDGDGYAVERADGTRVVPNG